VLRASAPQTNKAKYLFERSVIYFLEQTGVIDQNQINTLLGHNLLIGSVKVHSALQTIMTTATPLSLSIACIMALIDQTYS
jgi:hypothetical protein